MMNTIIMILTMLICEIEMIITMIMMKMTGGSLMSNDSQSDSLNITMSGTLEESGENVEQTEPFNQLSADKFPLICTFNEFLRMVDNSLLIPFFSLTDTGSKESHLQRPLIDLFRFETFYYPRLGDTTGGKKFKVCIYICMNVYMYLYIYIYTYIYICIFTVYYIHIYIHICVYTYLYRYVYVHTCTHKYTNTYYVTGNFLNLVGKCC
jgi:hypothetical protein